MLLKKKNEPRNHMNYRPISITPCLARLLEKIILRRLQKFMTKNKILIKEQAGFRKGRQTRDNLVFLTQKVGEALDEKSKLLCITFDIESDFDKVWHNGLIYKLIKIKIPHYLLKIIISFLRNRSFCVKIGDFISETHPITAGVPQGAVLSPTLFNLFINDIPKKFNNNSERYSLLLADDLIFMGQFKRKKGHIEKSTNKYLNRLESWTNKWRIKFAPSKCSYYVFTRAIKNAKKIKLNLNMHVSKIEKTREVKFLGFRFDQYLTGYK